MSPSNLRISNDLKNTSAQEEFHVSLFDTKDGLCNTESPFRAITAVLTIESKKHSENADTSTSVIFDRQRSNLKTFFYHLSL